MDQLIGFKKTLCGAPAPQPPGCLLSFLWLPKVHEGKTREACLHGLQPPDAAGEKSQKRTGSYFRRTCFKAKDLHFVGNNGNKSPEGCDMNCLPVRGQLVDVRGEPPAQGVMPI